MQEVSRFTVTGGLDLGDKYSYLCLIDNVSGEVIEESRLQSDPATLEKRFAGLPPSRIAMETGTHSPWVSRLLKRCGHEVLVANARQLHLIYRNKKKHDQLDAQNLARLARLDPVLLAPIQHRQEATQADLALIRSRDALVKARTQLINHVRGATKSFGVKLPRCDAASFHKKAAVLIPTALKAALDPLLRSIATLSEEIRTFDKRISELSHSRYPEAGLLQQVRGVGPLVALTFILTLESPYRFTDSRRVGAYLGLSPGRNQSGTQDPQQHITKQGDRMLRYLLVQSAQYILGPFGEDSDLRRHGEAIAARGGKHAKRRAVVAVARKLAVLLHRLWLTGEVYQPLYNHSSTLQPAA